eukprot:CAMPEP_0114503098 /NCGR_PEP_ID=MMETSP0109-20121206/9463_1 /TAXON_ID=29199 /ORGANISM="Chlorarachnion reptans, Strain CCCM449" /LENGTH=532 /DNA_ID=CAMNT_0001681097 /DNA_START=27 /DNA_END=1622 /DNA_ORIENTATION=-
MVKVIEFRIPLPLKTSEFKTALPYVVTRCSEELSLKGTGDKVEVLKNEPFDDGELKGNYTHKVFHVSQRIPDWIKSVVPMLRGATLEEESWNAFPFCRTAYSCKLLGEIFKMEVLSMHIDDDTGDVENALNLPEDLLAIRQVRRINIREVDDVEGVPHPAEYVPKKVSGRGPIPEGWLEGKKRTPTMCCYKVVKLEVSFWFIQERSEQYMLRTQVQKGITEVCTRAWCWLDEYVDMDEEAVKKYQKESIQRLEKALNAGQVDSGSQQDPGEQDTDSENKTFQEKKAEPLLQAAAKTGDGHDEDDTPTCNVVPTVRLPSIIIPSLDVPLRTAKEKLHTLMAYLRLDGLKTGNDEQESPTTAPLIELPSRLPPTWVPDKKATQCAGCKIPFGILKRKHHCRGCGEVMCHECTQGTRVLSQYREYYGPDPQRVCQACDRMQTEMEELIRRRRQSRKRSQSPREQKIRRSIKQKARELAQAQQEQQFSGGSASRHRCFKMVILVTAVTVVILAIATKPDSKLCRLLRMLLTESPTS